MEFLLRCGRLSEVHARHLLGGPFGLWSCFCRERDTHTHSWWNLFQRSPGAGTTSTESGRLDFGDDDHEDDTSQCIPTQDVAKVVEGLVKCEAEALLWRGGWSARASREELIVWAPVNRIP